MIDSNPPCGGCGGPHPFDTAVPSVVWNAVIRAKGLSEYLCTTCIVGEFAKAGVSFTAVLYGDGFDGQPIEVRIGGAVADDSAKIQAENNDLRWRLGEAEYALSRGATGKVYYYKSSRDHCYKQWMLAEAELKRAKAEPPSPEPPAGPGTETGNCGCDQRGCPNPKHPGYAR